MVAGAGARHVAPSFWQVFVAPDPAGPYVSASGLVPRAARSASCASRARDRKLLLVALDAR